MAERGFYSLIQYVPDVGRGEGANVGVVVVCPALGKISVRMSENNEGPKRRFLASSFDQARLTQAKVALAGRLYSELSAVPTLERLKLFANLEGNALSLTAPRTVVVDDLEQCATELFQELVFLPATERDRGRLPQMRKLVDFLNKRGAPIDESASLIVPVSGERLKVSFSYLNGAKHYVHPQGFPRNIDHGVERAQKLGAQGALLFRASENKPVRDRLVVVGRFADKGAIDVVAELLEKLNVRLVPDAKLEEFGQEIVATAHVEV